MDFTDRATCVLFGDGAGAVVLEPTDEPIGVLSSELGMDGSVGHILADPGGRHRGRPGPPRPERLCASPWKARRCSGGRSPRWGTRPPGPSRKQVSDSDDIDLLIPHQANVRIIDATARRLGFDEAKVYVNIHSYGNTSAATIPVALTEALEEGRITAGIHHRLHRLRRRAHLGLGDLQMGLPGRAVG